MHWRLMFTTLITLLAALPALAWLAAPWWLPVVAERQLAGYGLALKSMQVERPGWHETHLKQLHIRQTEGGVEIKLRGLTAGYNIARLIEGRLDLLNVDWLQLQIHAAQQDDNTGPALFAPAGLIASIPIGRMQIGDMSIRRLDSQGRLLQLLVGQASLQEKVLAVALREPVSDKALQVELNLDRDGRLQASLIHGADKVLQLDGSISEADGRIAVQSAMHVELAALDRVARQWLEMPEFRLQGSLDAKLEASLPAHRELASAEIRTALKASGSFTLKAAIVMPSAADNMEAQLDGEVSFTNGKGAWQLSDNSRLLLGSGRKQQRLQGSSLAGGFELPEDGWRIGLNKGAKASLDKLQLGDFSLAGTSALMTTPISLSAATDGALQLDGPAGISLKVPETGFGKNRIAADGITLRISGGPLASPKGRFEVASLKLTTEAVKLPATSLSGSFDLSHEPLTATGKLASIDGSIRLDWRLSHRPDGQLGELSYSLQPMLLGAGGMDIAKLIDTRDEYDLQAGSLSGKGKLSWKPARDSRALQLKHGLDLELASLAGFYKTNTFTGLNSRMAVDINEHALHLTTDNLSIGEFNVGIPIRNLNMNAAVRLPFAGAENISIGRLRGEALGGAISSERIDIDFARASNPFVIRLEQLDARQIAEIRKQEGLYADGTLDGRLPLDWSRDGLRISDGRLQARSPGGVIQYLGTESIRSLATTDRTTKMALDILSNLLYRQLIIGIDAKPDGEMMLRIELKGHNPEYENGRPIEFNLNIEENVLKLLYSLRMADEIGGRLEKQMQKKLRKK